MSYPVTGFKAGGIAFIGDSNAIIRKPNEGTFMAVLPSGLPMPFAIEVYALTVQDAYNVNIASQDTGVDYPAGSIAAQFQDEDVSFQDEDVLWEPHAGGAGDASVSATGHELAADVGTASLSGASAYTASGDVGAADVGTAVARGAGAAAVAGDVLNADVGTPTIAGAGVAAPGGDVGAADVGTAVGSGAAAIAATGDVLTADVGSATATGATVYALEVLDSQIENIADSFDLTQSGDIVISATGDELTADIGTATFITQAQVILSGDELTANAGTPTIGGAGQAVPGGDVGQADVGTALLSGAAVVTVSGDELTADVGTVSVSTAYIIGVEDSAVENHSDAPVLTLANGDAFPAGVEAQTSVGTAVAVGVGATVTKPHGRRRPAVWEWPEVKEKLPEVLPVVEDAEAFPRGVAAEASVGRVRVNGTARVIPMSAFGRSRIGVVAAEVDYTLRDQQEEEFIQILLAA